MPEYFAFDPHPRRPGHTPPPRSCDSQFHVFGPPERYPVRPGAAYEMPSATWAAALKMHRTLGIERGVIVQATTYGDDHSAVLDALAELGEGYKGCANALALVLRDDGYIARLHAAGVRGARFTRQGLGIAFAPHDLDRAIGRVKELGWYVKVQPEPSGVFEQIGAFENLDVPVIIDHMGRPKSAAGTRDPSFAKVRELLQRGQFWVMLSLSEKISQTGAPWDDVVPIAQAYIDTAPDRVIWGSDWPHPVSTKQPPNEGDLLELLYRFAPDAATQQRILVDNPARLFGFDT
jgi:predicted TIM-barrel fold metal-dependent hydrolase